MKKNKASSTAYTVAHGILHVAKNTKFSSLVNSEIVEACEKILLASNDGRRRICELNSPIRSKILPFLEWLLLPGATLNYVLRKKFIEEKVLEAIDNGITQIVNIGAGFDTLAYRLAKKLPDVNFIEIDHPATGREKTKALFNESAAMQNLHFIAVDLSKENLEDELKNFKGFTPNKKTLYICEGVLMYLKIEHVKSLFDVLKKLSGSGSKFVFSCMEPNESKKNNTKKLLHIYLGIKNELYNWYIRDNELPAFIKNHGYTLKEFADSETYKKTYLDKNYSGTLHKGEYVAVAEIS